MRVVPWPVKKVNTNILFKFFSTKIKPSPFKRLILNEEEIDIKQ